MFTVGVAGEPSVRKGGILLLDKPPGITSARAVAVAKRSLGGPKVGHLGTLDPFASGLLPLCVGEGTKLAPYLNVAEKAYVGVVRLGLCTDTLDGTGRVLDEREVPDLASVDWERLASAFRGSIEQVPPAFSAIKRGGVRMYELARSGNAPELEARTVTVHELALAPLGRDCVKLDVRCSKGTYVRSLARDIGERLGCGGILERLTRTRFGPFALADTVPLGRLEADGGSAAEAAMLGLADALAHLRSLHADASTAARLRAGQQAALARLAVPGEAGENARVLGPGGELVAVVAESGGTWRLDRVFSAGESCAP
jgi:tRNA pseudouridine55 synthase